MPGVQKSALRTMQIGQCLLDRGQHSIGAGQMLDGHDMRCRQRRHKTDAGIDASIDEIAIDDLADQDRACAAVAFAAAFLRACQAFRFPKPIE